jgi:hypothetical protein
MHISLADALQQVNLEVGRVYRCQVGKLRVEVRVEDISPILPAPLQASDVMLDPWVDLPAPQPTALLQASAGPPVLPDPCEIPRNERNR